MSTRRPTRSRGTTGATGTAKTQAAADPLETFERAVAGASSDEFIEIWVRLIEEAAKRVDNYADAVDDGASLEVLNEGSRFATRAHRLAPVFRGGERAWRARCAIVDGGEFLAQFDGAEAS